MSRFMKTKQGHEVEILQRYQTGFSSKHKVVWEIASHERLSDQEIGEVIESEFPSAGYGPSSYSRISDCLVSVSSWASAD